MQTILHTYSYDTRNPDESDAYEALEAKLIRMGLKPFVTWGGRSRYLGKSLDGTPIELETKHLFNNQWITTSGLRVFDWGEDYRSPSVGVPQWARRGHWIEQTTEMSAARKDRMQCGYCGAQYSHASSPPRFCTKCFGNEYLKEGDLPLLRLRCVADGDRDPTKPLSADELAELLPKYQHAQIHGDTERDKARLAEKRIDIQAKRDKAVRAADAELNGFTWLLDHGVSAQNCIYYPHSELFCFGFRGPLNPATAALLVEQLRDFPVAYEIKTVGASNDHAQS